MSIFVVDFSGTKKYLSSLKVKPGGILMTADEPQALALKTRYQEIQVQKKEATLHEREREAHLRQVAQNLLENGPGMFAGDSFALLVSVFRYLPVYSLMNLGPALPGVPLRSTARLPKKRPAEELDQLRRTLEDLECLKEPPEDTRRLYVKFT